MLVGNVPAVGRSRRPPTRGPGGRLRLRNGHLPPQVHLSLDPPQLASTAVGQLPSRRAVQAAVAGYPDDGLGQLDPSHRLQLVQGDCLPCDFLSQAELRPLVGAVDAVEQGQHVTRTTIGGLDRGQPGASGRAGFIDVRTLG
jgi:hypothetical protein